MSDKRTASERISDLEKTVLSSYQTMDMMARDLMLLKDAIKLLGNKLDAVVKGITRGETLSDDSISKIMVENNVEELSNKVKDLISKGILSSEESITDSSFIVGREVSSEDGSVSNPRLQFALSALGPELKEKFKGAKAGDILDLQEGKNKFEILETYGIHSPSPEAESEAPEAESAAESTSESA